MTFSVNIIDPTTGTVIGTTMATFWTDPVSGIQYTVPVGYDPQNTINTFNAAYNAAETASNLSTSGGGGVAALGALIRAII